MSYRGATGTVGAAAGRKYTLMRRRSSSLNGVGSRTSIAYDFAIMSMDRRDGEVEVWRRYEYQHQVAHVLDQLSRHTSSCSRFSCVEVPSALCPSLLFVSRVSQLCIVVEQHSFVVILGFSTFGFTGFHCGFRSRSSVWVI